jgi:hypothetical protein
MLKSVAQASPRATIRPTAPTTVASAPGPRPATSRSRLGGLIRSTARRRAQDSEEPGARHMKAFMCVQLVRNDFLSALPVDCLQLLLTTVSRLTVPAARATLLFPPPEPLYTSGSAAPATRAT